MASESAAGVFDRPRELVSNLGAALADLLSQEFTFSSGHLTALLNGCLFAPSILTFWFVNGVIDFSTAAVVGSVGGPAGLQARLLAYVLLVPTFLLVRVAFHLAHPAHRQQVLSGACPNTRLLSLDWFSVGILATGLPLALQDLGPWVGMNVVFVVGLFVLPRVLPERLATHAKLGSIVLGVALFLYANYGGLVPVLPVPAETVGPVATLALSDATTATFLRQVNSLAVGPLLVAGFGVAMNHVLTRPELSETPLLRRTVPRRDPDRVVVTSAALGTAFYLLVSAGVTGELVIFI